MNDPKVTVAVITKNEEKNIARCLESIKWADEIIVVDGYSTDKTAEIARSYGAKVVLHKFTGRFADDRNEGMKNASNDWVLHIDADDVVTDNFKDRMYETLRSGSGKAAYKFRRRNYFLGHSMDHGGFHHYIPNLVNQRYCRYEGDIHEVPVCQGETGLIEADIEHWPFSTIGQFVERQNRYSDIAAKDIFNKEGVLTDRNIRKGMIARSLKIFWKSYVKKQGYKEGIYGLVFAILFAFINFLKWAKYWELVKERVDSK